MAADAPDALLVRLDRAIPEAGYPPTAGQIVDATLVAAPRQRNTDAEKARIEAGEKAADIWPEKPAKAVQKDTDARWTVRFSKARPKEGGTPQIDKAGKVTLIRCEKTVTPLITDPPDRSRPVSGAEAVRARRPAPRSRAPRSAVAAPASVDASPVGIYPEEEMCPN